MTEAPTLPSDVSVLFDRVLVKLEDEGDRRSRAGIVIPATAQVAKRLSWALVVAVGPHVRTVRIGDRVLFSNDERYEVDIESEDFILLRERDLHAVRRSEESSASGMYL